MPGEVLPFYDIALDFEGEPILGPLGYQVITDEALIKQYVKNIVFMEFDPYGYVGLPNEQATADIIREDLYEILISDILLSSLELIPVIDIYPTANASLGFGLVLTDNVELSIDMGDTAFINLRAGTMLGYGEYDLSNDIYNMNITQTRYERISNKRALKEILLTHKALGVNGIYISKNADVTGFDENNIPVLPGFTAIAEVAIDRYNSVILLSDVFENIDGYVARSATIRGFDGTALAAESFQIINNYLVMDFAYTDYRGPGILEVNFIKAEVAVTKYIETTGAYVPQFASHERTNTQYKAQLGSLLPPGRYVVIYDSYGVQ